MPKAVELHGLFSRWRQFTFRYIEKLDPHAAEEVYEKGVAIYTPRYGAAHPRTLTMRARYATTMLNGGNALGAEAEAAELIPKLRSFGSTCEEWLRAAHKYHATALYHLGRCDEAAAEWDSPPTCCVITTNSTNGVFKLHQLRPLKPICHPALRTPAASRTPSSASG